MLKHFVYVLYESMKQFEFAVSINHDVMTTFQLHISDSEPHNLSQVVWVLFLWPLLYVDGQHINVLKHFVYV